MAAGGSGGWVGLGGYPLWRHCAHRYHTAARVRAVRFVICPSVWSKAALCRTKKCRDELGPPEWKGSCCVSRAYFVSRKVQAFSDS